MATPKLATNMTERAASIADFVVSEDGQTAVARGSKGDYHVAKIAPAEHAEYSPNGSCSCMDFMTRFSPKRKLQNPIDYMCKHLTRLNAV